MSFTLLVRSDRLRSILTRLAHSQLAAFLPLIALGLAVSVGWSVPAWAATAAAPTTLLLFVGWAVGDRLHAELDRAGLPCTACDLTSEEDAA